ncbi:hypothetical protein HDU85_004256 [Gaertneriomyces sp. JEL0708]|nr:hypothetical protein HDU85_004256 [Gaertneriomyces sp. JEL0708]
MDDRNSSSFPDKPPTKARSMFSKIFSLDKVSALFSRRAGSQQAQHTHLPTPTSVGEHNQSDKLGQEMSAARQDLAGTRTHHASQTGGNDAAKSFAEKTGRLAGTWAYQAQQAAYEKGLYAAKRVNEMTKSQREAVLEKAKQAADVAQQNAGDVAGKTASATGRLLGNLTFQAQKLASRAIVDTSKGAVGASQQVADKTKEYVMSHIPGYRSRAKRIRNWALGLAFAGLFAYGLGSAVPSAVGWYYLRKAKLELELERAKTTRSEKS